jgi:hypothetical protein
MIPSGADSIIVRKSVFVGAGGISQYEALIKRV